MLWTRVGESDIMLTPTVVLDNKIKLADITAYNTVNISYYESKHSLFAYVDYVLLKLRHFSILLFGIHGACNIKEHIKHTYITVVIYIYMRVSEL
jgi:hypothetical protein